MSKRGNSVQDIFESMVIEANSAKTCNQDDRQKEKTVNSGGITGASISSGTSDETKLNRIQNESEMKRITTYLPTDLWKRVQLAARLLNVPLCKVVTDALMNHYEQLLRDHDNLESDINHILDHYSSGTTKI